MRFKVKLHRDVVRFIRHDCSDEEQDAFYQELERVREDPLFELSEGTYDADLSRYALRFFRFKRNIAIFEFDSSRERIIVRQCRKLPGKPVSPNDPNKGGAKP